MWQETPKRIRLLLKRRDAERDDERLDRRFLFGTLVGAMYGANGSKSPPKWDDVFPRPQKPMTDEQQAEAARMWLASNYGRAHEV